MVGRPCGQFHGDLRLAKLVSTRLICGLSSARPIMMELRHARIASIARTFFGRTTSYVPPTQHGRLYSFSDCGWLSDLSRVIRGGSVVLCLC